MENKHPIDDLFRNGLASGQEPLSGNAWANMERMLNGENPYADESSRKRRFLPWIIGGGLVAALSLAGWWMQHRADTTSSTAAHTTHIESHSSPAPTALNNTMNQEASSTNASSATETTTSSTNQTSTTKNKKASTNKSSLQIIPESELNATTPTANKRSQSNQTISQTENNNTATANATQAVTTSETPHSKKRQGTNKESSAYAVASVLPDNKIKSEKTPIAVQAPTRVGSPMNKEVSKETVINTAKASKKSNTSTENTTQENTVANNTPRAKQVTTVELSERVDRTRDGSVLNKGFDTLSIRSSEEPAQKTLPRWMQPDADGKYHPRYVVLNDAQEAQAQQRQALASNVSNNEKAATPPSTTPNATTSVKPTAQTKTLPDESGRKQSKESAIDRLRSKAAILGSDMTAISGKSCPGMTMGVHAAINNPKNNFGGFQFGLSNLKPFGDYFSLLAEVKFFIRNNSGYSIRDIMTTNKNLSMDTMSAPSHTIYSYQVDSTSRLYNFKHFYALELPVIFQFHYHRLTAYAGLNMAYQFRINTSTVQRNFAVNHNDTVANQVGFSMLPEQGQDVAKEDFHARWGLGMVGGLSYSFNPQLYVDMRLVRNLNDNAQTLASRDVSANTFKVPNVQLSLGYRFRKFIPQQ